jgi:hypothetical protein
MPVRDPRLRIGGKVTAKACHVVHLSKCAQRYGINKHSKRLVGTVLDVTTTPVSVSTGRTSTLITTVYDFGESLFKEKTLNIWSVKAFVLPEDEGMSSIEEIAAEAAEADMEAGNLMEESVEAPVAKTVETPADIEPNTLVDTEPNTPVDTEPNTPVDTEPDSLVAEIVETPVDDDTLVDTESENPVATVHQTEWYVNERKTRLDVNGHFYIRHFHICTSVGDLIGQDSDNEVRFSRLEYFLLMFPPTQLTTMCWLTNTMLAQQNKHPITAGELLRFFGILILTTKFEFRSRAQLWSTTAPSQQRG